MFTLFFAGDTFAPSKTHQGMSVQQYLQNHFINCFAHLGERLANLEAVLGFEVMNEPHPGYIGLPTLHKYDSVVNLIFGDSPTPLQGFALGDGISQEVDVYVKSWPVPTKRSHKRMINQSKTSAWLDGHGCIWRDHGVWGIDPNGKPKIMQDNYFAKSPKTGEPVSFYKDFYLPFVNAYAKAIQNVRPEWMCFVEPLPNEVRKPPSCDMLTTIELVLIDIFNLLFQIKVAPVYGIDDHHSNVVFAPHWYDLNCVFYKKFVGTMTHDVQHLQKVKAYDVHSSKHSFKLTHIHHREVMLSKLLILESREQKRIIRAKSATFEKVVSATWVINLVSSVKWAFPWI